MPTSTPIARSKTAALSRTVDLVPRGYQRYVHGTVAASKTLRLVEKFHTKYGIGCTPAQRITRKKRGLANVALVLYWPEGAESAAWLLLATDGTGLENEVLSLVTDRRRLNWLGYELVRRAQRGRTAWTWKRPRQVMSEAYSHLAALLHHRHQTAIFELLERLARQPGFHGVRAQSWTLFQEARKRGYKGPFPKLFYMRKISHGDRLVLPDAAS
ncbi:MAG: hypothetical protein ITG07_09230 [Candidimonas sp.]|nr:hypothetical protein [Candidimonas sp.]